MKCRYRSVMALVLSLLVIFSHTGIAFAHPEPLNQNQAYGGTLIISNRVEPKTLNPDVDMDYESYFITHAGVYNRMVALNLSTGDIHPDLAESWEMSPDATSVTFELHPDAKWHDGEPVTSKDVEWTFNKIIQERAWQSTLLDQIEEMETPDEHTIIIRLKTPNAAFVARLGELNGPVILPMHIYEGTDWKTNPNNEKPIGSGSFKFVDWVKGSHIELVANEDYHWGRPYVDRLIVRFIPSQSVDMAALESDEIQYMSQSPPFAELARLSENPSLKVVNQTSSTMIWVAFNLEKDLFQDIRVRKAIAMAIDEEDIANRVYLGTCPVAEGAYLTNSWVYNPDAVEPSYDPAEAERLLDEAGYKKNAQGKRFAITITDSITMGFAESNQVIKEQLAKIGIDVTIESIEWGSFTEKVLKKYDFDIALVGGPHGPDPDSFSAFLETGMMRNSMQYSNPRVDELFALGRSAGR